MSRGDKNYRTIAYNIYKACNGKTDPDLQENGIRQLNRFLSKYFKMIGKEKWKLDELSDEQFEDINHRIIKLVEEVEMEYVKNFLAISEWSDLYKLREANFKKQKKFLKGMEKIAQNINHYLFPQDTEFEKESQIRITIYDLLDLDYDAIHTNDFANSLQNQESEKKGDESEEKTNIISNEIEERLQDKRIQARKEKMAAKQEKCRERQKIKILSALQKDDDFAFQFDPEMQEIFYTCRKILKEKELSFDSQEAETIIIQQIKDFKGL